MCHRHAGHPPSDVGVPHMRSNASWSGGAETTVSCGGTEANRLLGILADNQLIGYCTIEHIDRENHTCEVGIVIGEKDYWHKGIGSTVIREILKRAFTELHLHRVEAVIHADNVASIHCFARAGFQRDGTLRDAKYRDGRYVDLLVYSILDSEWIV